MKKVLFDTSVLVAALVRAHGSHRRCLKWLQKVRSRKYQGYIASHTIAELFAVLTRLPARPRISPDMGAKLVHDNIGTLKTVSLSERDYLESISDMASLGLSGGIIYDAIIARCALKCGADLLLTLNPDDFERIWPNHNGIVQRT